MSCMDMGKGRVHEAWNVFEYIYVDLGISHQSNDCHLKEKSENPLLLLLPGDLVVTVVKDWRLL